MANDSYIEILESDEYEGQFSMPDDVAIAWQYHDEIKYQERLATSYPQDIEARRAAQWLTEQSAW